MRGRAQGLACGLGITPMVLSRASCDSAGAAGKRPAWGPAAASPSAQENDHLEIWRDGVSLSLSLAEVREELAVSENENHCGNLKIATHPSAPLLPMGLPVAPGHIELSGHAGLGLSSYLVSVSLVPSVSSETSVLFRDHHHPTLLTS